MECTLTKSQCLEVFKAADTDKSGSLEFEEFQSCLQALDPDISEAQIDQMQACLGMLHEGQVDYDDFSGMVGSYNAWTLAVEQIREAILADGE